MSSRQLKLIITTWTIYFLLTLVVTDFAGVLNLWCSYSCDQISNQTNSRKEGGLFWLQFETQASWQESCSCSLRYLLTLNFLPSSRKRQCWYASCILPFTQSMTPFMEKLPPTLSMRLLISVRQSKDSYPGMYRDVSPRWFWILSTLQSVLASEMYLLGDSKPCPARSQY